MKTKRAVPLTLLTINVAFVLSYVFFLSKTTLFVNWRLKSIDSEFSMRVKYPLPNSHLSDVVIVGIDEASYRKIDRPLPWGREIFAVFLENLKKLEPKVIGMDFTFIGKSVDPRADQWFAEALALATTAYPVRAACLCRFLLYFARY